MEHGLNTDDDFLHIKVNNQLPAPPLHFGWMADIPAVVYISPDEQHYIANSLGITITNNGSKQLVPSGQWGTEPPVFKICFITIPRPDPDDPLPDPGKDSLTYDDLAKDIRVRVVGNGSDRWEVIPGYGSPNPSLVWELRPKTREIMGPHSSVELLIENIRTTLPGFATTLTIAYASLPGYADGNSILVLQKTKPDAGIVNLYADEANINFGDNAVLNWTTFAVDYVELSYAVDGNTVTKSSQHGEITVNQRGLVLAPKETTIYTLTPYTGQGQGTPAQFTVSVNVPQLTMTIAPLYVGKEEDVDLSWKVTGITDGYCILDPGAHRLVLSGEMKLNPYLLQTEGRLIPGLSVSYSTPVAPGYGEGTLDLITGEDLPLLVPISISAFRTGNEKEIASKQWIVSVEKPVIGLFIAEPPGPVDAGTSVKLSWTTQYTNSVSLTDSALSGPLLNLSPNGNQVVNPSHNTTYILACNGYQGPVQVMLNVKVNSVRIDSFTGPTDIWFGVPFTLHWETTYATSCKLLINTIDIDEPVIIEVPVNPQGQYSYTTDNWGQNTVTLVASGPNGPVSSQVDISVNHEPD